MLNTLLPGLYCNNNSEVVYPYPEHKIISGKVKGKNIWPFAAHLSPIDVIAEERDQACANGCIFFCMAKDKKDLGETG
jgi:hypothetical protein